MTFTPFPSFLPWAKLQVLRRMWLWENGEVYQGRMSLWFHFITTSENWGAVYLLGHCSKLVKRTSMNLEAVQLMSAALCLSKYSQSGQTSWPFLSHLKIFIWLGATKHTPHTSKSLKGGGLGKLLHRQEMTMAPQGEGVPLLHNGRGLGGCADGP